jgi:hypothetical protein
MEEALWPGGPTQTELDSIKAGLASKNLPTDLFEVSAGNVTVVARLVTKVEYMNLSNQVFKEVQGKRIPPQQADDMFNIAMLNAAVVWKQPELSFNDQTACGVIPTLIDKVMKLNGFDDVAPRRL